MTMMLRQLVGRAFVLGAVALVAAGVSGLVAAALGAAAGDSFVAGEPPSVHYSAARCADYREYAPHARTCEQAATEHHFGEVVEYRVAAGVFGGIALGLFAFARRRLPHWFATDRLPQLFDVTVAATAFGIAALFLLSFAIDQMALRYDGAGAYLSAGLVAAVAAGWCALRFVSLRVG